MAACLTGSVVARGYRLRADWQGRVSLIRVMMRAWRATLCVLIFVLTCANYTDIPYEMEADDFEWDDAKAASNLSKHGVSFREACGVFDDQLALIEIDDSYIYGEEREILIGEVEGQFLVVVYTFRNGRHRLISARKATAHERREYEDGRR